MEIGEENNMPLPESKKLVIYENRKTGAFYLSANRATSDPKGFATKDTEYGKTLSKQISNADLGNWVRKILQNCD